jgi:hypothetical protein
MKTTFGVGLEDIYRSRKRIRTSLLPLEWNEAGFWLWKRPCLHFYEIA